MFREIINSSLQSTYDFQKTACPRDPLSYLFSDWVSYYRLKWAIASALQPQSILEIGVRYGYSAAAFLNGCPTAHYLGIDLDSDSFGGVKEAINWAQNILQEFDAELMIADTQQMDSLPGGMYDLIHVDGQQDGDGSFYDLELAMRQARYILVDGYLWTQMNFQSVSDFLFHQSDRIEFYGVIPGYAGELLIKIKENNQAAASPTGEAVSSLAIQQCYTSEYYLTDCGGYEAWHKSQGKSLEDTRLQAMANLAALRKPKRVWDAGCGRGELAYHFASSGCEVTAVDYSPEAIALAQQCFEGETEPARLVDFKCDNVCTVLLNEKYDVVTASDLIEHLSPAEVDLFYNQAASHLTQDGLFVIHTFPNLWYYRYEYARRRKIAQSIGAWLPAQPRSAYELLMHINEQSPRMLRKQLQSHFKSVLIWFGDPGNVGGSLLRRFTRRELCAAPSLFALASHSAINPDAVRDQLQMLPMDPLAEGEIRIQAIDFPGRVRSESSFEIKVRVINASHSDLRTLAPYPVCLAYHWLDENDNIVIWDGLRTSLLPLLASGQARSYLLRITAPGPKGSYRLRVTLVQEGIRWFDSEPTCLGTDLVIEITE